MSKVEENVNQGLIEERDPKLFAEGRNLNRLKEEKSFLKDARINFLVNLIVIPFFTTSSRAPSAESGRSKLKN